MTDRQVTQIIVEADVEPTAATVYRRTTQALLEVEYEEEVAGWGIILYDDHSA